MWNDVSRLTRRFVDGRCPTAQLPTTIRLSGLRRMMKRLWRQSVRDIAAGVVVEHAATLVRGADGKVRLDYAVAGIANAVTPVYTVGADETCIGTYHTHPYAEGLTGMAFSDTDIASVIEFEEWISLVQSGDDVFALIRTTKTVDSVVPSVLEADFDQFLNVALRAGSSERAALWTANIGVCRRYGLAFYAGQVDGNLEVIFKP